jgi:putative membrane protein
VSATVGFILKILLLPFIIVTLGIVYFLVNGLMLKLASEFVSGFRVNGCLPAVVGSILLSAVDYVLSRAAGLR